MKSRIKKSLGRIINVLRKIRISLRLNIVFIGIMLILFIVSFTTLNYFARTTVVKRTDEYITNYINQLGINLDAVLEQNSTAIRNAASDVKLYNAVKDYHEGSISERDSKDVTIRNAMNAIRESTVKFCGAEICSVTDRIASLQTPISTGDISTSRILQHMAESNKEIEYFGTIKLENDYPTKMLNKYVVISAPIKSRLATSPAGSVSVTFSETLFNQIVNTDKITDCEEIYIATDEGIIVSHQNKEYLGEREKEEVLNFYQGKQFSGDQLLKINGTEYWIRTAHSEIADWKIVALIDYDALSKEVNQNFMNALIPLIISLLITFGMSRITTSSILEPMNSLLESIKSNADGDKKNVVKVCGADEMTQLSQEYNTMIDRMEKLNRQRIEAVEVKNKAEMRALYAQVSPHFLYNTLDMINWMAYLSDDYEICDCINDLSNYFRTSLNFGKDIHTVANELEHAKYYCNIQKRRYADIFFEYEMDDNCKNCLTLKILLQPLIENSIQHGLSHRDFSGTIKIKIKRNDNTIIYQVIDDGVGIKETKKISSDNSKHSGYGFNNINQRIHTYYGEDYGAKLSDNEFGGTTAEIIIPVIEEEIHD